MGKPLKYAGYGVLFGVMVCACFAAQDAKTTGDLARASGNNATASHPACRLNAATGKRLCTFSLAEEIDSDKSKAGQAMRTVPYPVEMANALPFIEIRGKIAGVSGGSNRRHASSLQIYFVGETREGKELPLAVQIEAVILPNGLRQEMGFPAVIVDRYPHDPQSEKRLPGELNEEARPPRRSPLDDLPEGPFSETMACGRSSSKGAGSGCVNLWKAHGVYGDRGIVMETLTSVSATGAVVPTGFSLSSKKKRILLPKNTVLLLAVLPPPASHP